jgi:5'-3' exonuclease
MKKLLILDSNSILNRAFYGVRYLSAKDGTPTNAIYGFLNILLKLIKEQEPDYICAAFDVKAPSSTRDTRHSVSQCPRDLPHKCLLQRMYFVQWA